MPTKRIVRTLTTESSGGNRLTYEKELLNSKKNSHFYKTNHPGFPHALSPSPFVILSVAKNLPHFPHALPSSDKRARVSLRAHMQFALSSSFNLNVNYAAGIVVGGVPPSSAHFGVTLQVCDYLNDK
jgi:hypothetical protein